MNIRNSSTLSLLLLGVLGGPAAFAVEAMVSASSPVRSNEIRVGMYFVTYQVKADDLTGPFVPAGVNIDVNNVSTPYIRRLAPHWVAQIAAGIPPKTETVGKGPATVGSVPFDGQVVSTARWFSP